MGWGETDVDSEERSRACGQNAVSLIPVSGPGGAVDSQAPLASGLSFTPATALLTNGRRVGMYDTSLITQGT